MKFSNPKTAVGLLLIAVILVLFTSPSFSACNSDIVISLSDTSVAHYETVVISIYIENNVDTLKSFQFWVQSSLPPDIFTFQTDSGLVFDTTGSILAGWEYISLVSISGTGSDVRIEGLSDLPSLPVTPGAPPDSNKQLLGRLHGKHPVNPFDSINEHTVELIVNTSFTDFIQLETSDSDFTIWEYNEILDTNGFVCTAWQIDTTQNPPDSVCLNWQQTAFPPWDSTEVVVDTVRLLNLSRLCFENATVQLCLCGDVNSDGSGGNILDLNSLVNRVFRSGPQSDPPAASDVNCDGANGNILDLNFMVNKVFRAGPAPCNGPGCL